MVSFDGGPIFNEQNLDQFILASVTLKFRLYFSLPDLLISIELSFLLHELWLATSSNMVIVSNSNCFVLKI